MLTNDFRLYASVVQWFIDVENENYVLLVISLYPQM